MPTAEHHYNAEISAGSLMLRESRAIAVLLLAGADEAAWHKAIYVDNILQKNVPSTARRMVRLIRNRLEIMAPDLWEIVVNGTSEVALQSLMAAAIKLPAQEILRYGQCVIRIGGGLELLRLFTSYAEFLPDPPDS